MLDVCPLCDAQVLILPDRICPRCCKNVDAPDEVAGKVDGDDADETSLRSPLSNSEKQPLAHNLRHAGVTQPNWAPAVVSCPECGSVALRCTSCGFSLGSRIDFQKSLPPSSVLQPKTASAGLPEHLTDIRKPAEVASSDSPSVVAARFKRLLLEYPKDNPFIGYSKIVITKTLSNLSLLSLLFVISLPIVSKLAAACLIMSPLVIIKAFRDTNELRRHGVTSSCPMWNYMKIDILVVVSTIVILCVVGVASKLGY